MDAQSGLLDFMAPLLTLSPIISETLRASPYQFVVTGANGWLGKATLDILRFALGSDFAARVTALGSRNTQVIFADGFAFPVYALPEWSPSQGGRLVIVFHYAFLTKDKVNGLSAQEYVAQNNAISDVVKSWIVEGNIRGMVLSSSGAVYDYLNAKPRDPASLLYGRLKHDDELAFGEACEETATSLVIPRIFNLSGPYINKFDDYALASFIFQILHSRPVVINARHPVFRSYYFIGDLIEICLNLLFQLPAAGREEFDVAGDDVVELGELAHRISILLADRAPKLLPRHSMANSVAEDRYIGDRERIEKLERSAGLQPLALDAQIIATCEYIERTLH